LHTVTKAVAKATHTCSLFIYSLEYHLALILIQMLLRTLTNYGILQTN